MPEQIRMMLEEFTPYQKEDLRVMHYTGRDSVSPGGVHRYRSGVMTRAGDLELSAWRELVMALIKRNGDLDKLEELKAEAREMPWIRSEKEALQKALELYCIP